MRKHIRILWKKRETYASPGKARSDKLIQLIQEEFGKKKKPDKKKKKKRRPVEATAPSSGKFSRSKKITIPHKIKPITEKVP